MEEMGWLAEAKVLRLFASGSRPPARRSASLSAPFSRSRVVVEVQAPTQARETLPLGESLAAQSVEGKGEEEAIASSFNRVPLTARLRNRAARGSPPLTDWACLTSRGVFN